MLILTRRAGESIVIDKNIRVTVLAVDGERVKIGVDAPRDIPVVRQELLDEVRRTNLEAVTRGEAGEAAAASLRDVLQRHKS
ncbi:MAG: carbon storage regulator CsrA [Anaerolineae bacterium]